MAKSKLMVVPQEVHACSIDYDSGEIYLHGWLDPNNEWGVDFTMASVFIKNIRLLDMADTCETILVHMCTCGGDWNYGMAIYDAIKAAQKKVVILAYAHARSMSSIIPQAADIRVIMPNADFMIHEGIAFYDGTHRGLVTQAKSAEAANDVMLDVYVSRCVNGKKFAGWSKTKIREFLVNQMDKKQEWYVTAREAVDYGFMDAVLGDTGYETIEVIKSGHKRRRRASTSVRRQ